MSVITPSALALENPDTGSLVSVIGRPGTGRTRLVKAVVRSIDWERSRTVQIVTANRDKVSHSYGTSRHSDYPEVGHDLAYDYEDLRRGPAHVLIFEDDPESIPTAPLGGKSVVLTVSTAPFSVDADAIALIGPTPNAVYEAAFKVSSPYENGVNIPVGYAIVGRPEAKPTLIRLAS